MKNNKKGLAKKKTDRNTVLNEVGGTVYSREKVIELIQYAMQYAQDRHMDYPHTYWDEWIENNVK